MSTKSQSLFERSKRVSPGGVHSPVRAFKGVGGTPPFVSNAKGFELHDEDGNTYIDFCMSWGPLIFGHQDPETKTEVEKALSRGWSYGAAESRSLELAELITDKIPFVEKIRFVNSGTEAVMSALRLARGFTGRSKVVKFDGCYHGHVDSMLVRSGSGLADLASPDSAGVTREAAEETLVASLDDPKSVEEIFSRHGDQIAALIIEPLPANFGLLLQKKEFLQQITETARKHGALVIFDEVISGFRIGFGGMAADLGIDPDLVTYGKVIGGGFPVGAFGGREDIMSKLAPEGQVYQAGTLSANPVAMTAGLTTLKKLLETDPYAELDRKARGFAEYLNCDKLRVQQKGSIFWMVDGSGDPVRSPTQIPATQKENYPALYHFLLSKGFYLAPSAFEVGFVSTVHTEAQLKDLADAIKEHLGV